MNWEIKGFLEVKNDNLRIDGVSAVELAERFGTPLFVFSEARIWRNVERLRCAAPFVKGDLKICYAAKALSTMAILRAVKDAGADLEVNSGGELWKALRVGFAPEQIIFNGTSKTREELEQAIGAGIYAIQCDSLYELELIETVAADLQKRANVSLRLVPEIETKTHSGLQTALRTSKFGMMSDELYAAFERYGKSERLNLCGIHLHLGSQTPDAEPFELAIDALASHVRNVYEKFGARLSHINLGGGFPVKYLSGDDANDAQINDEQRELFAADLEPSRVFERIMRRVYEAARNDGLEFLWNDLTILIEPGRSVVADAGVCLTTVRNAKQRSHSQLTTHNSQLENWLLTDAGFNILLSMETYKWYYRLISATRAVEAHDAPYKVAGPLCDGGDVYFDIEGKNRLPDYRLLPDGVQPGEVLALLNCGAYSVAQMSQYNARFLPPIVLIRTGGAVDLIRRRDSFEDLIANDVW